MAVIRLARVGGSLERLAPEAMEVQAAEPLVFRIDAASSVPFQGRLELPINGLAKKRVISGRSDKPLDFAVTGLAPGRHELRFHVQTDEGTLGGTFRVDAI